VSRTAPSSPPRERSFQLCSLVSEASGEEPIGSAWSAARYLLVELALPWGSNVLEGKQHPAGFQDLIIDLYTQGTRWGLVGMAPDEEYSVPGMVRVIDLELPPTTFCCYQRREYLFPKDELVPCLRALAADGASSALASCRQPSSPTRDLLVCTHGAVDACCAKFGYPIYRLLRQIAPAAPEPVRVWRCTHFGGHRFAATLLDMPEGRYWGRLKPAHLSHLVRRDVPVANLRDCYRGWAALPHPLQQVAEAEAFVRGGWAWTECAVTPSAAPPPAATNATITFTYHHAALNEQGAIAVDVLPNGTIATQHTSGDPALHEAQQYRTVVRHVEPGNGLLGQ
jgi:hypothetical protein